MISLYHHQQQIIDLNPKKYLLAFGTGTGKSLIAIKLVEKNAKSCLVVCPKSLQENWNNELIKFGEMKTNWQIISKENFKKEFLAGTLSKYEAVIIDEAHFHSIPTSQLSKATVKYVRGGEIPYVYLLTATPYLSTVWSIYTYAKILGYDWSYMKFKTHFFYTIRMGARLIPKQKEHIEKEVSALIHQIGATKSLEECVDVPDSVFMNEFFELTDEQRKGMECLEDFLPIVLYTKQHQICGGTLSNEYEDRHYANEKSNRVVELAGEHNKMIVVCRYNAELIMLKNKLIQAGFNALILNGETKIPQDVIDKANKVDKIVLLVNAKCSTGYNLPYFDFMVFYSLDFSLVNYIQMLGRCQRISHPHKCIYTHFIIKDTIDEDVYQCIQKKENFDIEIYARQTHRLKSIQDNND